MSNKIVQIRFHLISRQVFSAEWSLLFMTPHCNYPSQSNMLSRSRTSSSCSSFQNFNSTSQVVILDPNFKLSSFVRTSGRRVCTHTFFALISRACLATSIPYSPQTWNNIFKAVHILIGQPFLSVPVPTSWNTTIRLPCFNSEIFFFQVPEQPHLAI